MSKSIITFMLALICAQNFANVLYMSKRAQTAYVQELGAMAEKRVWDSGREDVSSSFEKITEMSFMDMFSYESNMTFEQPLSNEEISNIYSCLQGYDSCQLYRIIVTSGLYGYFQTEVEYVLLYTKNRSHLSVKHILYAD